MKLKDIVVFIISFFITTTGFSQDRIDTLKSSDTSSQNGVLGCSGTVPVVAVITGGSNTVCVNGTTPAFTNSTPDGIWSIINGTGTASIGNAGTGSPTAPGAGVVTGLSAGTVTVVYSVTGSGNCVRTVSRLITVNTLPDVSPIIGWDNIACIGGAQPSFSNETPFGVWSVINGTGTANVYGGIVTGLTPGTVTLVYTVTSSGCSRSVTKPLTVTALPVIAAITGGSNTVSINEITPAFTNLTPAGVWSVINETGTASITPTGVVTGLTPGIVTIVYTVTTGGCKSSVTSSLTIIGPCNSIVGTIKTLPLSPSANSNTTFSLATTATGLRYAWILYGSDNTTEILKSTAVQVSQIFSAPGNYRVKLIVTDATNCPTLFQSNLTVTKDCTPIVGKIKIIPPPTSIAIPKPTALFKYQGLWLVDDTANNPEVNSWVDYLDSNDMQKRAVIGAFENGCKEIIATKIVASNGVTECAECNNFDFTLNDGTCRSVDFIDCSDVRQTLLVLETTTINAKRILTSTAVGCNSTDPVIPPEN
jgi:hypothetical protein